MSLAWLFPWRRPLAPARPARTVEAVEQVRAAAEMHDAIALSAQAEALERIGRQRDQGGFLAQLIISADDLRALTNQALDRTRR